MLGNVDYEGLTMRIVAATLQVLMVSFVIALAAPANAQQAYPNKPIRIVVPFPPGGSNDILARLIGKKLTEAVAVQTIVDNRGGANTIIGASALAKAAPAV